MTNPNCPVCKGIGYCTNRQESAKTKDEHFSKGYVTDKFWNSVYNILYAKKYAHCLLNNQRKTTM